MYIFNRRQDEELDALSASVQRIEGVGLTIHDELVGQVFPCCMYNSSYGHPLPRSLFHAEVHILLSFSSNIQTLPRGSIYILFPLFRRSFWVNWTSRWKLLQIGLTLCRCVLYLLLHLNTICHEPSSSFPPHFLNSSACISWNCMFAKVVSV